MRPWYTSLVTLAPIGRTTRHTDLAAASLREAILDGRLQPGEVLVERRIGEQLGVSKTPVREALIQLGNSGLLTTERGRGVRVRRLTRLEARSVYEQRLLLEPWAVGNAIAQDPSWDGAIAANRRAGELLAEEDWPAMALENRRFHRELYRWCHNPIIVTTLDTMQDLTALATLQMFWEVSPTAGVEHGEHSAILERAQAGDADGAKRLVHQHITVSVDRMNTLLEADSKS